jgi:hypothetical protein
MPLSSIAILTRCVPFSCCREFVLSFAITNEGCHQHAAFPYSAVSSSVSLFVLFFYVPAGSLCCPLPS